MILIILLVYAGWFTHSQPHCFPPSTQLPITNLPIRTTLNSNKSINSFVFRQYQQKNAEPEGGFFTALTSMVSHWTNPNILASIRSLDLQ